MNRCILGLLLLVGVVNGEFLRDNTKEVVLDTTTKLMWQDNNDAKTITKTWSEAIIYCEALTLGGFSDWHLPNFNELYHLADRSRHNPAINPAFTNVASDYYWSATTLAGYASGAWLVSFGYGYDYWDDKSYSYYVRCVRATD